MSDSTTWSNGPVVIVAALIPAQSSPSATSHQPTSPPSHSFLLLLHNTHAASSNRRNPAHPPLLGRGQRARRAPARAGIHHPARAGGARAGHPWRADIRPSRTDRPARHGQALARAVRLLTKVELADSSTPIIDGHIDLPIMVRVKYGNDITKFDLRKHMVRLSFGGADSSPGTSTFPVSVRAISAASSGRCKSSS